MDDDEHIGTEILDILRLIASPSRNLAIVRHDPLIDLVEYFVTWWVEDLWFDDGIEASDFFTPEEMQRLDDFDAQLRAAEETIPVGLTALDLLGHPTWLAVMRRAEATFKALIATL